MPLKIMFAGRELLVPSSWITKDEYNFLKDEPERLIDILADDPLELIKLMGEPRDIIKIIGWEKNK